MDDELHNTMIELRDKVFNEGIQKGKRMERIRIMERVREINDDRISVDHLIEILEGDE